VAYGVEGLNQLASTEIPSAYGSVVPVTFFLPAYIFTGFACSIRMPPLSIVGCVGPSLLFFLSGEGPHSRRYGRTATLWWRCPWWWLFFILFLVMEHRNEIDRGKLKYLGEKTCPSATVPPQMPHGLTRDRTRVSAVGVRRLTAWAMVRPWTIP
jgi:hypothetical protein